MTSDRPSDRVIEETERFWEERTGEPMSREHAREAIRNVVGFFELLAQWDRHGNDKGRSEQVSEGHKPPLDGRHGPEEALHFPTVPGE